MKIVSWNVNGLRAVHKKGFFDYLKNESPDVLCLQETKAHPDQIEENFRVPEGYYANYHSCQTKKGYSGVVTYSKIKPEKEECGFGIQKFDQEGRVVQSDFGEFLLFNIYFPNGGASDERQQYKLDFYDALLPHLEMLEKQGRKVVVCGDYNTAHHPIDLARPKENIDISGFRPIERERLDTLKNIGYVDTFREFTSDPGHYSWWSMRMAARERNVGWRIDYHFVTKNLLPQVERSYHQPHIIGSDHCPVVLELKV